jgi:hypothetical protein
MGNCDWYAASPPNSHPPVLRENFVSPILATSSSHRTLPDFGNTLGGLHASRNSASYNIFHYSLHPFMFKCFPGVCSPKLRVYFL